MAIESFALPYFESVGLGEAASTLGWNAAIPAAAYFGYNAGKKYGPFALYNNLIYPMYAAHQAMMQVQEDKKLKESRDRVANYVSTHPEEFSSTEIQYTPKLESNMEIQFNPDNFDSNSIMDSYILKYLEAHPSAILKNTSGETYQMLPPIYPESSIEVQSYPKILDILYSYNDMVPNNALDIPNNSGEQQGSNTGMVHVGRKKVDRNPNIEDVEFTEFPNSQYGQIDVLNKTIKQNNEAAEENYRQSSNNEPNEEPEQKPEQNNEQQRPRRPRQPRQPKRGKEPDKSRIKELANRAANWVIRGIKEYPKKTSYYKPFSGYNGPNVPHKNRVIRDLLYLTPPGGTAYLIKKTAGAAGDAGGGAVNEFKENYNKYNTFKDAATNKQGNTEVTTEDYYSNDNSNSLNDLQIYQDSINNVREYLQQYLEQNNR